METRPSYIITPTTSRSRSAHPVRSRPQKETSSSISRAFLTLYKARVALICLWNIPEIREGAILYSVSDW